MCANSFFDCDPGEIALVVAHPGHELRIFSWMEQYRPTVHVLTDGSGRERQGRVRFTTRLLEQVGATRGSIYARYSDIGLYNAVLQVEVEPLRDLVDELTSALVRQDVKVVVGDAAEGEFMAHDLFREMRIIAVERAEAILQRPIEQYEFAVDSHPHNCPLALKDQAVRIDLDERAFERKLAAAYQNVLVRRFVNQMLAAYGTEAFRSEFFFPFSPQSLLTPELQQRPKYEQLAEELVARGVYPEVIRFRQHLLPIYASLREAALPVAA